MKVKVISVFRDKFTGKYYNPGEVIEISEEFRVLDVEKRKLGERVEVKVSEEKKEIKISLFEKEFEKKILDRKSTRLNSSHNRESRMPSSA